jgi:hypothetical protein
MHLQKTLPADGISASPDRVADRTARSLVPLVKVPAGFGLALRIAAAALVWRAFSHLTAFFANVVFPLEQRQPFSVLERPNLFWDALVRYDSGWYFGIARNGYQFVDGGRNNLAFFPSYPVSMGYLGYLMGGGQANYYYAGLIISWLSFAGAMVMLYRLARLDMDHASALKACMYTALFPFAFFHGAVYPTSLFLFLVVTAFYAFRQAHWVAAAFAGALVTCTRVNGILIFPALALLVWQAWRHDPRQLRRGLIAVACVPAGLAAYSAYNFALSGSFVEWYFSIQRWDYTPGQSPLSAFAAVLSGLADPYRYLTTEPLAPYDVLNGLAATFGLLGIPLVWRRFGAPYALFVLLNLALPLSSGQFVGLGRYTAVLFPLFLWLATRRAEVTHLSVIAVSALLYMLCQALFVTLHPVF